MRLVDWVVCHLTNSYCAVDAIHARELAREEAERIGGPLTKKPFVVTDNGWSFIARRFGAYIKELHSHVRIQYRTPTHLGLLERFHRTLTEEEVYWWLYDHPAHCRECVEEFRQRYNRRRPHRALIPVGSGDPLVPEEVYTARRAIQILGWQGWAKGAKEQLDRMLTEQAA
jgi:transposase InsO family protein